MSCIICGKKWGLIKAPLFGKNAMICRECQRKMLNRNLRKTPRISPNKNTGVVKIYEEIKSDNGLKIVCRGWS